MRNHTLGLAFVVTMTLVASLARLSLAAGWPGPDPEDAARIMPVSEIKRGMRGYGLTVFQGTTIEKFDVEILGVLKQMNVGRDLIMIRAGGGPITARRTGIISGMSGSPVYIDGRLIGAVAFATQFGREPLGMVTPIADMLEAWDENLPRSASGYSSSPEPDRQPLPRPLVIDGVTVTGVCIDPPGAARSGVEDGVLYMQPLMTPVMVSGVSARGLSALADILRPFHLQPMAGPGGGGAKDEGAGLVPGAAVGVSLATGDVDLTGIGTLTYRRGDRVLAFGHPMLGIGAIDAPLTTAYVNDVIPGYRDSFKLATPLRTVGRVFQDRPWSVAGRIGEQPRMIPVVVEVDDLSSGRRRTCRTSVIDHPLLASRIVTLVVGESIYQIHPSPGDATAEVEYEVVADQVGKITRRNVFFDPVAVDAAALSDIGALLQLLSANRFQPLDIRSVSVKVRITGKRGTALVDRIFVKKSEYEPGETVEVGVVLRPYKGERVTRTCRIRIPATATDGKVTLLVRGGAASGSAAAGVMDTPAQDDDSGAAPPAAAPGIAGADNVKQLVEKYLEREKNNEIVVQLLMRSTAVNVLGEKLTGLPDAIADVMKSSRNSGVRLERDEVKEVFAEDMIIQGAARLTLDIKKKSLNESKPASRPGAPPTSTDDLESRSSSLSKHGGDMAYAYTDNPDTELMPATVSTASLLDGSYRHSLAMAVHSPNGTLLPFAEEPSVTVTEEVVEDEADAKPDQDSGEQPPSKPSEPSTPRPAAPAADTSTGVKTVVRQMKTWMQKSQADFAKGTFAGVASSSDDRLRLVQTVSKLAETPEQFAWSLAPANDGVYVGTGNGGRVYHVSGGEAKVFCETGELQVHSLARDSAGNLWAGTSPNGRVFRISPEGKGEVALDADERYVLALAADGEGNVYAGVGDAGKIYRIAPDGGAALFAEIGEQQILCLHCAPDGTLLAGTGINGVLYRVDRHGRAAPIFDAAESAITSVVSDGKGSIYAGTSPKGVVYRIAQDGLAKSVFSGASRVLSMAADSRGSVYVVSDSALVRIDPDETSIALDSSREKAQFLSLALDEARGALYAGTGNIGAVYRSALSEASGSFESAVHDAKMVSRWARISWVADAPEGSTVELFTRTGNVDTPDSTWSEWSAPYKTQLGERISSPAARYIQYRVDLRAAEPSSSPTVSTVNISYMTPNQPPTVKLTAPTAGNVWAGKQTIRWTGSDPDKDTLTYDVYYSGDGGANWTALVGGVSGASAGKLSEEQIVSKIKSELEQSPDIPEEMKKAVTDEPVGAPDQRRDGSNTRTAAPSAATRSSTSTSYSWDTKKVEDGVYVLKVVASDKTSNATDALTDETVSEPFLVCNTAPKLRLYRRAMQLAEPGAAVVRGSASGKLAEVVGVQYRVDGGDWMAAAADDGMFDSPYEGFTVTTDHFKPGAYKVEVQAVDAAGNASSATIEVKVLKGNAGG